VLRIVTQNIHPSCLEEYFDLEMSQPTLIKVNNTLKPFHSSPGASPANRVLRKALVIIARNIQSHGFQTIKLLVFTCLIIAVATKSTKKIFLGASMLGRLNIMKQRSINSKLIKGILLNFEIKFI
jgi:hypothetical protein